MVSKFVDRIAEFRFEVVKAPRVFENGAARVGQHHIFGGPVQQPFAEFVFEALQRERDRGLGAAEFFGGAREAALGRNRHKDANRTQLHPSDDNQS